MNPIFLNWRKIIFKISKETKNLYLEEANMEPNLNERLDQVKKYAQFQFVPNYLI